MHGKKIINNSLISILYKITMLLMGFITRKIFIVYLGNELLGLNSLFSNLLDLLNLADLGIGVAVQYQLYEPLVKNDKIKLSRILTASKKIYNFIGISIIIIGIILSFFIKYLIKETTYQIWFIQIAFLINVIGIALTYFFVHKRLFLQANEKIGIVNIIDLSAKFITVVLSMISIVIYRNYFLYLTINALYGLISNLIINYIFNKQYYDIKSNIKNAKDEVKTLTADLKNVLPMKLSNYVYNSTDNIIISKIIGLTTVAIYSNYMTIINGIMGIEYLLGNVISSSFGKMVKEIKDYNILYKKFSVFEFVQFLFTNIATISLCVLCSPFIKLWLGDNFLIDRLSFCCLIIDFFIHSMYQPAYVMFSATGKFKEDKYITLISAIINIIISLIMVKLIGLSGVIVGTLITDIYIWFVRSYQIVKKYFKQNISIYYVKKCKYILGTIIGVIISILICRKIYLNNLFLELIIKSVIALMISLVSCIVSTYGDEEFNNTLGILVNYIKKGKD